MRGFSPAVALLLVLAGPPALGQDAATPLQGTWTVTGGEHEGQPLEVITGGRMTITGRAFDIETASGNRLSGELRLNPAARPMQVDLVHADGTTWRGIYEVSDDDFRLIYVETDDARPTAFVTSVATAASLVTLVRAGP